MRRLIDAYGLREPILSLARGGRTAARHLRRHDPAGRAHRRRRRAGLRAARPRGPPQRLRPPARQLRGRSRRPRPRRRPLHGVFIRAPIVTDVGPRAEVLARDPDGAPVAVRQGRVLATAFHPELTGDRRLHRLLVEMIERERWEAGVIEVERTIRAARLTDRQALTDLSRRVHASTDAHRRSLGVPAPSARVAAHQPLDAHPVVAAAARAVGPPGGRGGRRAGRQLPRDRGAASRRLGHHRARRGRRADGGRDPLRPARRARRGGRPPRRRALPRRLRRRPREPRAVRPVQLHGVRPGGDLVARAGAGARPAVVAALVRQPRRARAAGRPTTSSSRPAGAPDAWHLFDLWTHATPPAIARHRGLRRGRLGVGRQRGDRAAIGAQPDPPLQPGRRRGCCRSEQRAGGFAQHGACRSGPHYLRFLVRDGTDGARFLRAVLERMGGEAIAAGILAPVRTYESAGTRAAEAAGFEPIGRVTLLVREVRAQVREPAMVPATR